LVSTTKTFWIVLFALNSKVFLSRYASKFLFV
jgi:hypothetical protein